MCLRLLSISLFFLFLSKCGVDQKQGLVLSNAHLSSMETDIFLQKSDFVCRKMLKSGEIVQTVRHSA